MGLVLQDSFVRKLRKEFSDQSANEGQWRQFFLFFLNQDEVEAYFLSNDQSETIEAGNIHIVEEKFGEFGDLLEQERNRSITA